jgi:NADPH:quinone reductase-like Zn-dependent oxidoreductase
VLRSLAVGGQMLVFGTLSNEPLSFSPRDLMTPGATLSGFWLGHWMAGQNLVGKLKLIRTLTSLILDGTLASDVGESFPLDRIADAVRSAEKSGRHGKTLLKIGTP